ncbi:MAG: hypothetical protein KY466_06535 [Gemmatimonadetes bacterium]|nr:hypothetical protein [Gemmatimonadota bacterium]
MIRQGLTTVLVGTIFIASGCADRDPLSPVSSDEPLFAQTPADGNGNKEVIPIDFFIPDWTICESGEPLDLKVNGWVQVRFFDQPDNRNIQLTAVQLVVTYSNSAGETFVWHEVGVDRVYFDQNGDLIVSSTGRIGPAGLIGHLILNLTTGAVERAGKEFGSNNALACDALT